MAKQDMSGHGICAVLTALLLYFPASPATGHVGGAKIVPAALSVAPDSALRVSVAGLTGAETATFTLAGTEKEYGLGTFTITKEDFEQTVLIPAGVSPGTYKLRVDGGGRSAGVVLTVSAARQAQKTESPLAEDHGARAGSRIELNVARPAWLTVLVVAGILISLTGGIWILARS